VRAQKGVGSRRDVYYPHSAARPRPKPRPPPHRARPASQGHADRPTKRKPKIQKGQRPKGQSPGSATATRGTAKTKAKAKWQAWQISPGLTKPPAGQIGPDQANKTWTGARGSAGSARPGKCKRIERTGPEPEPENKNPQAFAWGV